MYDRPETRAANDRLWELIRDELGFGPAALTRGNDPWDHWNSPDLLLSQTCGLPYRSVLHPSVHLVGTPDHRLEGCLPGTYRSALVMRKDDPRSIDDIETLRFAYNSTDSQSGWAAPWDFVQKIGKRLTPFVQTGSHEASAISVAQNQSDLASLDAISWKLMQKWDDFAAHLRVVGWSDPTPALPFVTADEKHVATLRSALEETFTKLSDDERICLQIFGVVQVPKENYLEIPLPPVIPET